MKFKYRRYYFYYLARVAASIFYILPLRAGLYLARFFGWIAFMALGKYRRITVDNLKSAFGATKSDAEIQSIARKVFENVMMIGVEMLNFPRINASNFDKYITVENASFMDETLRKGSGAILLTAHFGNWELLAMTVRVKGYPGAAVGRRIYFHKYDKWLNKLRRVHDVNIVDRDKSPRKMLKVLRNNGVLGVLADQDVDSVDGVFVNFFGRPAYTPIGPSALSKASGASIVPGFMVREGQRHRLIFDKPVEFVDTGDKEKDIATNTQAWSDVVESFIRRHPDHWVWMHRRWKTRPQ